MRTSLKPIVIFFLLFITSCSEQKKAQEGKLNIVTTTGHIADLVRNVTGDKATVSSLMGPGVDPHLYKASLSDLKKLKNADIIFYNGLHLEGKMGEVFHKLSRTEQVIAVSDGIPKDSLLIIDIDNQIPDPHIWFDIVLWQYCLEKVKNELVKADPTNRDNYILNATNYKKELEKLNTLVNQQIKNIPKESRLLVTAHDAFGYFGERYNIEVLGLQGISTLSEYGLNEITSLSKLLVERKVKAVFIETSVSEKAIESVIIGCRQRGHEVKIGGSLYSDALGGKDTPEGNYIGMFRSNVNLIAGSLQH